MTFLELAHAIDTAASDVEVANQKVEQAQGALKQLLAEQAVVVAKVEETVNEARRNLTAARTRAKDLHNQALSHLTGQDRATTAVGDAEMKAIYMEGMKNRR